MNLRWASDLKGITYPCVPDPLVPYQAKYHLGTERIFLDYPYPDEDDDPGYLSGHLHQVYVRQDVS